MWHKFLFLRPAPTLAWPKSQMPETWFWLHFVGSDHRYQKSLNRLLQVCYVPAARAGLKRLSFFFFISLLRPLTVLMKQTRQPVCAVKQSIYLDVYGPDLRLMYIGEVCWQKCHCYRDVISPTLLALAIRIISICVTSPKVTKESPIGSVCHMSLLLAFLPQKLCQWKQL